MNEQEIEAALCARCMYCDEPILPTDIARRLRCINADGVISESHTHRECVIRSVVGSVGHQLKMCRCYGGDAEDPPGMTKREAAIAAVKMAGLWKEPN